MTLEQKFYFTSPVQVVKVTKQNLDEVAEWCGGTVAQVESKHVKGRMDSYVWVPTPKASNMSSAFPGMYVTKRVVVTTQNIIKVTWAVFRRDYFDLNYFEKPLDAVNATWGAEIPVPAKRSAEKINLDHFVETTDEALQNLKALGAKLLGGEENHEGLIKEIDNTVEVLETDIQDVQPHLVHNHILTDGCDLHDCEIDRYREGEHYFTDKIATTRAGQKTVITDRS